MTPAKGARIAESVSVCAAWAARDPRGLLARGLRLAARGLLVVLLLGDGALGEEAHVALAVGAQRSSSCSAALVDVGLRLGARERRRARVELREDGALGDVIAALDERLDHAPGRVGREVGPLVRREHARQAEELRDRLLDDDRGLDVDLRRGRRRLRLRGGRLVRAAARRERARRQRADETQRTCHRVRAHRVSFAELSRVEPERHARVGEVRVGLDARDVGRERVLARLQDVELRGDAALVAVLGERRRELAWPRPARAPSAPSRCRRGSAASRGRRRPRPPARAWSSLARAAAAAAFCARIWGRWSCRASTSP